MSNLRPGPAERRVLHSYTLRVVDPSDWRLEHHKGWDERIMNVNVWRTE